MATLSMFWPARARRRRRLAHLLLAVLFVASVLLEGDAVSALERDARQRALLATVIVVVPDNSGQPTSGGSGTVLDAEQGYILTNFHVIGDRRSGDLYNDDGLAVIGVNPPTMRGAPVLRYVAELVKGDPEIDLALLKIVALFDDPNARLPTNLGLSEAPRGVSGELLIGDPIYVLGFPSLGGDTITYTAGTVSGFLDENRDGVEEWMKTDAEVNHGNSGGLAVNDNGEFIGVPTAGYTDVESAGKISLIRPGDLALTYYDAWSLGQDSPGSNTAQIVNMQFGEAVRRNGTVVRPAVRFDSGVTDLYAAYEYRGFADGQEMSYTWYRDGRRLDGETFPWSGGASGSDWVSISNEDGLADGFYEVELSLDGRSLYRGGVMLGAATSPAAAVVIGDITFAEGVDNDGNPLGADSAFSNVDEVYGVFAVQGMRNGMIIRSVWYFENQAVLDDESPWDLNDADQSWLSITHRDGLPVGAYKLEIYVDGELAQSGGFTVTDKSDPVSQRINVIGVVSDADNQRRKVSGAQIVFLQPGVAVDDWIDANYDEALIHATGTSNRSGEYSLDAKLTTGESYSIVVLHDKHQPVIADGYQIPVDASDPYVIDVTMQRK